MSDVKNWEDIIIDYESGAIDLPYSRASFEFIELAYEHIKPHLEERRKKGLIELQKEDT